jgi:hypothetical protein
MGRTIRNAAHRTRTGVPIESIWVRVTIANAGWVGDYLYPCHQDTDERDGHEAVIVVHKLASKARKSRPSVTRSPMS